MSNSKPVPRLKIAPRVTRRHGELFAEEWLDASKRCEAMIEAFAEVHVMEWPDDNRRWSARVRQDPAQARYMDVEDEILARTFEAVKGAVAEAFVKAAKQILGRERRRW
jgi:hypothetical protein